MELAKLEEEEKALIFFPISSLLYSIFYSSSKMAHIHTYTHIQKEKRRNIFTVKR